MRSKRSSMHLTFFIILLCFYSLAVVSVLVRALFPPRQRHGRRQHHHHYQLLLGHDDVIGVVQKTDDGGHHHHHHLIPRRQQQQQHKTTTTLTSTLLFASTSTTSSTTTRTRLLSSTAANNANSSSSITAVKARRSAATKTTTTTSLGEQSRGSGWFFWSPLSRKCRWMVRRAAAATPGWNALHAVTRDFLFAAGTSSSSSSSSLTNRELETAIEHQRDYLTEQELCRHHQQEGGGGGSALAEKNDKAGRTVSNELKSSAALHRPSVHLRLYEDDDTATLERQKEKKTSDFDDDGGKEENDPALHGQGTTFIQPNDNNNDDQDDDDDEEEESSQQQSRPTSCTIRVHTYVDPATGRTYRALHTSKRKFRAFLQHQNVLSITAAAAPASSSSSSSHGGMMMMRKMPWQPNHVGIITTQNVVLALGGASSSFQDLQDDNNSNSGSSNNNNNIHNSNRSRQVTPTKHNTHQTPTKVITTAAAAEELRRGWRDLWKKRQLLTYHTAYLTAYPSDRQRLSEEAAVASKAVPTKPTNTLAKDATHKRGCLTDLLHLYVERMSSILLDEQQDARRAEFPVALDRATAANDEPSLVSWLRQAYGDEATEQLMPHRMEALSVPRQLAVWKDFLTWFRSNFPYFYDQCQHCGASMKDDVASGVVVVKPPDVDAKAKEENNHALNTHIIATEEDDNDEDEASSQGSTKTFLGYVYPSEEECASGGKASRTELFQCHRCGKFTRFPRQVQNAAWHVIADRRGRCGEYAMLLYRILRALRHESRWIVDVADHLWAEVLVTDPNGRSSSKQRWVHLDPCEAAVDENLIYQGWGKKQTYILSFYAPLDLNGAFETSSSPAIIEDITAQYTTETLADISERRDEPDSACKTALKDAIKKLQLDIQSMQINNTGRVDNNRKAS